MKVMEIKIHEPIIDIDYLSRENYIYLTESGKVFWNELEIKIPLTFQPMTYQFIRIVSNEQFLIFEEKFDSPKESPNTYIFSKKGDIKKSFFIQNPQQILVTGSYIIATYSPTSVSENLAWVGFIIYDLKGNQLYKDYDRENPSTKNKLAYWEVKAIVQGENSTFYYLPYDAKDEENRSYPVVKFDLQNFRSEIIFWLFDEENQLSKSFYYPMAFSQKNGEWLFQEFVCNFNSSPSKFEKSIFYKRAVNAVISNEGELMFPHLFRGLPNGKFITGYFGTKEKALLIEF